MRNVVRRASERIRVGLVVHAMRVAGAEVLVTQIIRQLADRIEPTVFCLEEVGALGHQLRDRGIDVVSFGRRPGLDVRVAWQMSRELRARRISVLHTHQYSPFFYSALARVLSGTSVRIVFTEHGRHHPDLVSRRRRVANRLVFERLADEVNAVSRFSADSLRDVEGFEHSRIDVIENGIETGRYEAVADRDGLRRTIGLDRRRRYIANVARFHPVKDQATLLRAFRQVADVRADADLLLVGDGPLRPQLEQLARELHVGDRVRFLGVRPDVPDILRAVDVFALTSVSEAASITLLEAMAARLPVVVTAVGGNPEIVRHDVDGFLVPRADAPACASALLRVLDDARGASAMGAAGAARVREHYRLDRTIERYFAIYAALAGQAPRHVPSSEGIADAKC